MSTMMKKCSICLEDKALSEFYTRYDGTKPQPMCRACQIIRGRMRVKGVYPPLADVRAAIHAGVDPGPVKPALNSANHAPAPKSTKPLHPKRAEAYRLLREADADEGSDPSGYVYCIGDGEAVKIGKSKDHPQARLKGLQTGNKRKLALLGFVTADDRTEAEAALHAKYHHLQPDDYVGEWFPVTDEILAEFGIAPWGARTGRVTCSKATG